MTHLTVHRNNLASSSDTSVSV